MYKVPVWTGTLTQRERNDCMKIKTIGLATLLTACAQVAHADSFTVSDIRVEGLQRVSAASVFNAFPVNARDQVDDRELADAARQIEHAGADFLLIATNTMHKVAPQVEAAIDIPLLHIADATAESLVADGITRVGLLGTRFTMEQDFYKQRLSERYGIDVVVPDDTQRECVHRVIFEELCLGRIESASREAFLAVIDALHARGAQAVILGCTEIAMLIKATDTQVPLYDTTALHAQAAVKRALSDALLSEDTP